MAHDTSDDCCLYHALFDFLDKWAEAHSPMNIDETIDVLITIAAEDIAMYPDAKVRKFVTKREMDKLAQRVREFRAQGRYPVPLPATPSRSTEASDNDNHRDQAECAEPPHDESPRREPSATQTQALEDPAV